MLGIDGNVNKMVGEVRQAFRSKKAISGQVEKPKFQPRNKLINDLNASLFWAKADGATIVSKHLCELAKGKASTSVSHVIPRVISLDKMDSAKDIYNKVLYFEPVQEPIVEDRRRNISETEKNFITASVTPLPEVDTEEVAALYPLPDQDLKDDKSLESDKLKFHSDMYDEFDPFRGKSCAVM